jgi:preprotein translocase subunit YajC
MAADSFLILVVLLVLGWFFVALPYRRYQRGQREASEAHEAMQDALELGDEIITAGGLHATIEELGESELRVEIAPDVVVTLDRRAVAAVAREVEDPQMDHGEDAEPR